MASYKSQFDPPRRVEDQTPYAHRTTTNRLPQRYGNSTTIASLSPAPVPSKLQKKKPNRDGQLHSSRVATSQRTFAPKVLISEPNSTLSASKSTPQASSFRLPKLEVPRTAITPTPSLVSGSSVSTTDSPRSNVLKKKQSSVGVRGRIPEPRARQDSMSSQEERRVMGIPGGFKDPFSETVLGITVPQSSIYLGREDSETDFQHPSHYNLDLGPMDIMTAPTPLYALSTTPSTRYSESPGAFSVSSTPTSMSSYSYSPGVTLPSKPTVHMQQASPLQSLPSARGSNTHKPTVTLLPEATKPRERQVSQSSPAPRSGPSNFSSRIAMTNTTRDASESTAKMSRTQAPPELAHLANTSSVSVAARRPSRPSRDGTSDIGLRGPSPIIQSNMTSFPSSHKRTPSAESVMSLSINNRTRFGIPSKISSRNPSPNPSLASGFAPSSRVPTRGNTPDLEKQRSQTLPTSTPAPSPQKSSRFGFFTRRTKADSSAAATKPEKKHRRGPIAGTGHEGYGRYAIRGRNDSTGSVTPSIGRTASAATTSESLDRTPSTRKSSVTSTSSTDMDGFFLERLTPRVIRGSGGSTELTRSPNPIQSPSSLNIPRSSGVALKKTTSNTSQDSGILRPTLLPSAMSDPVRKMSPMRRPALGFRRPSESDDDSKRSHVIPASKRTSRIVPRNESAKGQNRKGPVNDYKEEKEGNWLKSSPKHKDEKEESKAPRKWNFFQRAHAAPRVATPRPVVETTTASPAQAPVSRSVAHYALPSESGIGLEDIEQLIEEDDSSPEDSPPLVIPNEVPEKTGRLQSMLLPPKPILPSHLVAAARPALPKVPLRSEGQKPQPTLTVDTSQKTYQVPQPRSQADLTPVTDLSPFSSPSRPSSPMEALVSTNSTPAPSSVQAPQTLPTLPGPPPSIPPPRPSRLAQVGRIPRVVSRRNQAHQPPSHSFSRPFAADKPHPSVLPRAIVDSSNSRTVTAGPVEPFPTLQGLNALTHASAIATISPRAEESNRQSEFFKFPQRKDSDVSYSSSSGTWSFPPTTGTAVVPGTGSPQQEDEIWNEYDDLIDEVLSPAESNERGSNETPTQMPADTKASRAISQSILSALDVTNPSLHLRRSRLLSVLHAQSPTSPNSFSEFLQSYGERNISVVDPVTGRLSFPSTVRMSADSGLRNRPNSNRSSLPASLSLSARQSKATLASSSEKSRESASANRYRDTQLMEIAEAQADGLASMANLRFGALMTSKWLSFGRVLFSPAHFELKNPNEDRVLVIDGLGKDWSYYCALTYPEASIYNLGPGASSPSQTSSTAPETWSTLANHRHINHSSLSIAFPFPKGFFACVVLRFPSALPSSIHRFVLSECKRVLRPGGYLELSVLDLDLVNMGNRARRAVRGLKVKMQVAEENISLRNISDEIMGLLGRKGFTECNRCFVGVPVAGHLPDPNDFDTTDGRKRKGSTASKTAGPASPPAKTPNPEVSFSDLLNMQSSSESTDNGIANMVARVGRWWYSRCYESLVLPEAGEPDSATSGNLLETSIWRDDALIAECEKRGTSFRLLIGYAQKPEVGVRRTVSV
jgi:SAM-dependent methyltransferase